jgi:hypothetical protein
MANAIVILRCPVCHREVALAPTAGDETDAQRARDLFVEHAELLHGASEMDGLLFYAEAVRRKVT